MAIEKLLFTHFDEDFDDGTSLDLAVLDNELKDFLLDDVSEMETREEHKMKTFEELTYFVDTKDYMKAYGKVAESIDNAELDKAKELFISLEIKRAGID